MPKFKAIIEYDGTNYCGWQLQPNVPTVQGEIEQALEKIFLQRIPVYGAGRTDAGVHAQGQVIHLVPPWRHPAQNLLRALNSLLPPDVAIKEIGQVDDNFHARHSAVSKTYRYRILNREIRSPLKRLYSWQIAFPLDLDRLKEASLLIVGTHDFATFGTPTSGSPSTVREIFEAQWQESPKNSTLAFSIRGSGFLRYMVRSLVGTLIQVGSGKVSVQNFRGIIDSCDRSRSGPTAPPHGLSLISVQYDH